MFRKQPGATGSSRMAIQEERKPRLRGQRNGTTARQRDLIQKRQGDITGQQGIMDFFFFFWLWAMRKRVSHLDLFFPRLCRTGIDGGHFGTRGSRVVEIVCPECII